MLSADDAKRGHQFRLSRKTVGDTRWRATSQSVEAGGCRWMLVAAQSESTAEVKYFVTNATDEPLSRVLRVAFRRATIEIDQADYPPSRRWVYHGRTDYHQRDGVARTGRVVPAATRQPRRSRPMSDTTRRTAPPRA